MTSFAPLFLAFLLNCCGIYIFSRPKKCDNLPYLSYVIFLISVYFFLYSIRVIPTHFRKLFRWAHLIIEFAVIMLLMEFIVTNLWYPLELGIMSIIKSIPHMITCLIQSMGINYNVCDSLKFLKSPTVLTVASYLLSLFFFLCIGHATKVLNLCILTECGIYYFILEATDRAKAAVSAANPCRGKKKNRVTFSGSEDCEERSSDTNICSTSSSEASSADYYM